MEQGHALRYQTVVILEGAYLKDFVAFTNVASLGCNRALSGANRGEASGEVSDVGKQYGISSNNDNDNGYPLPGPVNVVTVNY